MYTLYVGRCTMYAAWPCTYLLYVLVRCTTVSTCAHSSTTAAARGHAACSLCHDQMRMHAKSSLLISRILIMGCLDTAEHVFPVTHLHLSQLILVCRAGLCALDPILIKASQRQESLGACQSAGLVWQCGRAALVDPCCCISSIQNPGVCDSRQACSDCLQRFLVLEIKVS